MKIVRTLPHSYLNDLRERGKLHLLKVIFKGVGGELVCASPFSGELARFVYDTPRFAEG